MIKRAFLFLLLVVGIVYGSTPKKPMIETRDVTHVATALNHLTVFEFGEQVTTAALGNGGAFQVEWKDNRVFVKPLRMGAATDLFVWTASGRHDYELDPPGEVKDMDFVIQDAMPTPTPPAVNSSAQTDEMADALVTKTMLEIDRVDHDDIKDQRRGVTVRIEAVFESKTSIYVRYSIVNLGDSPYRVLTPKVTRIIADHPDFSLIGRRNTQLDPNQALRLGPTQRTALAVSRGESRKTDLKPGDRTQGIVVIKNTASGLTVLELAFGPYRDKDVSAVFVF